jgi:DMSO/TMAO reductase YedYZ molybdopterin-dependent catalytic subunit
MKTNERQHPELTLQDEEVKKRLGSKTRRSFLTGGIAAAAGIGFYEWVTSAEDADDVPWPQRRVLDVNGKLSHAYLSDNHLMPTYSLAQVGGVKPNGNIGMDSPLKGAAWHLDAVREGRKERSHFTLADIQALPKVEMITKFCCIEGWSGIAHWGGARFSDFTRHFLGPDTPVSPYVYMATADEQYYVGLDRKSALHPQTLLAYEQDGKPLEERRGAPLRLVIPVKYGIKNIKRIGLIQYMSNRPSDYWAEEGYDWFAGL